MEEKWRKELKYTVTEGESIVTARRLSSFMQRDKNLKGGREYLIRSLYFDNLYEKVLKEKLSGTAIRDKFRIRYYDFDTAFIRLEKKSKRYAVGHKYQCRLTAEEVQKIIDGDLAWMETDERPLVRELFLKMKLELFRPSVIGLLQRAVYLRTRQCAHYLRQGYLLLQGHQGIFPKGCADGSCAAGRQVYYGGKI